LSFDVFDSFFTGVLVFVVLSAVVVESSVALSLSVSVVVVVVVEGVGVFGSSGSTFVAVFAKAGEIISPCKQAIDKVDRRKTDKVMIACICLFKVYFTAGNLIFFMVCIYNKKLQENR